MRQIIYRWFNEKWIVIRHYRLLPRILYILGILFIAFGTSMEFGLRSWLLIVGGGLIIWAFVEVFPKDI